MKNAYNILIGNYEWNRSLGRSKHRWIRLDIKKIFCEGVDWFRVQLQALVNTVKYLRVPCKAENLFTSLATIGFSERTLIYGVNY
jgi:hypothetical protein